MVEENDIEKRDAVSHLLGNQGIAVLASSHHGHPSTSLVAFAHTDELKSIIFFLHRDHDTYRNLKADRRASLFIDSREKIEEGYSAVIGLRVTGVAWEIKNDDEVRKLRLLYLAKHPLMRDFINGPDISLFKLTVDNYRYVANFDESFDFDP